MSASRQIGALAPNHTNSSRRAVSLGRSNFANSTVSSRAKTNDSFGSTPAVVSRSRSCVETPNYMKTTASSRSRQVESLFLPKGFTEIPQENIKYVVTGVASKTCYALQIRNFNLVKGNFEDRISADLFFDEKGSGKYEDKEFNHELSGNMTFDNFAGYFIDLDYSLIMMQKHNKNPHEVFKMKFSRDKDVINIPKCTRAMFKGDSRSLNLLKALTTKHTIQENKKKVLKQHKRKKNYKESVLEIKREEKMLKLVERNKNDVEFCLGIKREDAEMEDFEGRFSGIAKDKDTDFRIFYKNNEKAFVLFSGDLLDKRCKALENYITHNNKRKKIVPVDETSLHFIRYYLVQGKINFLYDKGSLRHDRNYVEIFKAAKLLQLPGLANKIKYYLLFNKDFSSMKYIQMLSETYPNDFCPEKVEFFKNKFRKQLASNRIYQRFVCNEAEKKSSVKK